MRTPIAFCALALALTLASTPRPPATPFPASASSSKGNPAPAQPSVHRIAGDPCRLLRPGSAPFSGIVGLQGNAA